MRKTLEFSWQGEDYSLLVTFDVIEKIDHAISLNELFKGEFNGDLLITKKARFIALLMKQAGAEVEPAEIYDMLTTSEAAKAAELYSSMLWCVIGEQEQKKKDEAAA